MRGFDFYEMVHRLAEGLLPITYTIDIGSLKALHL